MHPQSTSRAPEMWSYTCKTCGEPFEVPARRARQRIASQGYPPTYCSPKCLATRPRAKQVPHTCEWCQASFTVYASEVEKAQRRGERVRYCSLPCRRAAFAAGNQEFRCEFCGVTFTAQGAKVRASDERGWRIRFCSTACYDADREQHRVLESIKHQAPCLICGTMLVIRDDERVAAFRRRQTCSPNCQYELMIRTRQGGARKHRLYPKAFDNTLRAMIRARDGFACRECGVRETSRRHDVHHIDYDKQNCRPGNLITLCMPCHRKTTNHNNRQHWVDRYQRLMRDP